MKSPGAHYTFRKVFLTVLFKSTMIILMNIFQAFSQKIAIQNRRRHFFINKPLQTRYMVYVTAILFVVTSVIILSLYFGIWGGVLDAFSNASIREDLLIATRLTQYEDARLPQDKTPSALTFFKQAEKLSLRQREIFKSILDQTNQKLVTLFVFLLGFIAWGSVFLSHKIAGPLYRFEATLKQIEKGDLATRVKLRKFDEAQFVADHFNETIENLDFTFGRLKNIIRENEANPERMKSRLLEELSKFKTSADR